MKRSYLVPPASIAMACVLALAVSPASGSKTPGADFEKLKSLEGTWQALDDKGGVVAQIIYEPVAGGTSLLERIEPGDPGHPGMISVYHMDGDDLVMTHYCGAGNQPTMRAAPDGDQIVFSVTSVANLAKPTEGHMHGLKVTFQDQDHFSQEWLWTANGKDQPHVFNYTRVRK